MELVNKPNLDAEDVLDVCCRLIVLKMGNKSLGDWRSHDYNRLSSQLGKQTKVYLSENTLKRIFGKLKTPHRYFPQKATRDALAQFIGYRDWQEFELITYAQHNKAEKQPAVAPTASESPEIKSRVSGSIRKYVVWFVVFVIISLISVFYLIESPYDFRGIRLVCENPVGDVPHTAVFKLKDTLGKISNHAFQVDFLDEALPATIKSGTKVTKFFRNPGVVYATLSYKGKPVDTVSVLLKTNGWVANSGNDTSRAYPINNLKPLDPSNIYVTTVQLDSAGLNLSASFLVGFSNIKKTNINGDNFDFSCKVFAEQNRPGTQCVETTLLILGEHDRHVIRLFRKSCVAFAEYKFAENRVLGAEEFLGNLAFDPENGGKIRLKVDNKVASIFLNDKEVLTTTYKQSIGKVMGIKILFGGIGKAISPSLIDLTSGEAF